MVDLAREFKLLVLLVVVVILRTISERGTDIAQNRMLGFGEREHSDRDRRIRVIIAIIASATGIKDEPIDEDDGHAGWSRNMKKGSKRI